MRRRPLLIAAALVVGAVMLAKAAVTRGGVGAYEYLTIALLIAVLLRYAYFASRAALRGS